MNGCLDPTELREAIDTVLQLTLNDDEFNKVEYDFRGNPQYSKMITKLCSYNRRSEFILDIVRDLINENHNCQIMILAHNKSLLTYLFNGITHRNIASVGYYLGGMKEFALKESEKKQIIIATYAMASEALDIKTLTTLLMATPKTEIEQSVGRILREKHSKPIVVDIIDSHSIFQNQWVKRQKFYKKQKYKILKSDSIKYYNKNIDWEIINNVKDPDDSLALGKCLVKLHSKKTL
jgi:superfamily II DNA or RNA helicase